MCIAILKPYGKTITDEALSNSFDRNKDGAGIAYTYKGKLIIEKGYFDKKKFIKAVRNAEAKADGDMLIHCRIGTSGLKDANNCHPHKINEDVVLIHNGILDVDVPKDSKVSDTVIFIRDYLTDLPKDFMYNNAICNLIEAVIGDYNKFVLLNSKGESRIINEKAGIWDKGIWYSNESYIPYIPVYKNKRDSYMDKYWRNDYGSYEYQQEEDYEDDYEYYDYEELIDIYDYIASLDVDELEQLGEEPIWSEDDQMLVNGTYENVTGYFLWQIDEKLQKYYDKCYQFAMEVLYGKDAVGAE